MHGRAEDHSGAVRLLRPAHDRLGDDDLEYRLANLEAVACELDAAASRSPVWSFGGGDEPTG